MSWRGATSPMQRVFACLPYLIPLMDVVLIYSRPFFRDFPTLSILLLPLQPFLILYTTILGALSFGGMSLGGLLLFIGLYMLVVRNENIPRFIRFNTMQSIVIGIALSLFGVAWQYILGPILVGGAGQLIGDILFNVVFLGTVALVIYSIVQTALGRYAEIPTISDAVNMQVR